MFLGMSSLTTIYASSDFPQSSTYGVLLDEDLFNGCVNLVGGNGTTYSQSHTDETYAKIDTPGTPGYFTLAS